MMRKIILVLFLIISNHVLAVDIPEYPWHVKCTEKRCFMQIPVPFNGSNGMEQVGLAVAYDRIKKQPQYIAFFVPPTVDKKSELMIRFINSVPDGNSFKLVPSKDGFIGLPINDCNPNYCTSRVHSKIKTDKKGSIDLLSELLTRDQAWILFMRRGKPERALIPVYKFRDEFAKISGKTKSNN